MIPSHAAVLMSTVAWFRQQRQVTAQQQAAWDQAQTESEALCAAQATREVAELERLWSRP